MKTSKMQTGNFLGKHQRVLTVSLLLASIVSCQKGGVLEPSVENLSDSTLNSTVSARAIGNLIYEENADAGTWDAYPKQHIATSYGLTASTTQFYNGAK